MTDDGLVLGMWPEPLHIPLVGGGEYKATLRLNVNWPVGTVMSLILNGTPYNAVITDTDAVWLIEKAVADAIPNAVVAKLRYVNGTDDEIWAIGEVVRFDG